MTCQELRSKISRLEDAGWVKKLQRRLMSDDEYKAQMLKAHRLYSEFRWSLLSEQDKQFLVDNNWADAMKKVGIAGIRDYSMVKCLHTHYSHYVSRPDHGNVVGRWVQELLEEQEPLAAANEASFASSTETLAE